MAFKLIIPGADFSALGNPKVEDYIESLPGTNLTALYLFDQGAVGAAYAGPAVDYSGNGNAGTLAPNSNAYKTAGGVTNVAPGGDVGNNGFGILSTPLTDRFTVFGVSRDLYAQGIGTFMIDWLSSGNTDFPASGQIGNAGFGNVNYTTDGQMHINRETKDSSANLNIGLYNRDTAGAAWTASGTRPTMQLAGNKNAWVAWVLSFDKGIGATLRALGQSVSVLDAADATTFADKQIARGARHLFGVNNFQRDADGVKGETAMAGVYSGVAKSVAEMDVLIAAIKARLASRIANIS